MILNLRNNDCVKEISTLKANSEIEFVCDPPYGLKFMDRDFDDLGEGREQVEWHKQWLNQAYRVLRPNGVVRAFSGSRTQYYLILAMYEIGFLDISVEVWNYKNGFPKALDISKEFDRLEGNEREILDWKVASPKGVKNAELRTGASVGSYGGDPKLIPVTAPSGELAKLWEGWYTALKPTYEPVIVGYKREKGSRNLKSLNKFRNITLLRKDISEDNIAKNVERHGSGAINIDACRISDLGRWCGNLVLSRGCSEVLSQQMSVESGEFFKVLE